MSLVKIETRKQWNQTPCGTSDYLDGIPVDSLEYFEEIRRNRYEVSDRWMKRVIDFSVARNKRLLEIGHGIGTDLLTFCEAGAEVSGIDITEKHHELARRNFEVHERDCTLKLCDASDIDFPSQYFDVVYSHGVLHHTPDTVRCVAEASRVLKPGGLFILSMYHTYSAFHLFQKLAFEGIWQGKLRNLGYRGLMATLERGADGIHIKPLVKTYRKSVLRHILADFSDVTFRVAHFQRSQIPILGEYLPRVSESLLDGWLGWYVIAFATK